MVNFTYESINEIISMKLAYIPTTHTLEWLESYIRILEIVKLTTSNNYVNWSDVHVTDCLKIIEGKSSNADLTPTRRSRFHSSMELNQARVPTQTRNSTKPVFQLKRGAPLESRSNSNTNLRQSRVSTQTRACSPAFQQQNKNHKGRVFLATTPITGLINTHVTVGK